MKKWERFAKIIRIVAVLIIVALVGFVGYQVYDFYKDKVGYTPTSVALDYFDALGQADYETVYALTNRASMTDLYGRQLTKTEFFQQVRAMTGGNQLVFDEITANRIHEDRNGNYLEVLISSSVGGGESESRVIVEIKQVGEKWLVTWPFGFAF